MESGEEQEPGTIHAFRPGKEPNIALPVPGIRFALLEPAQQAALLAQMQADPAELHRRLQRGERAILALTAGGEIAGYGWVSYDAARIYELGVRIPLPPGHAYIWDCATLPAHRGRGIFPGLLCFLLEILRRQGIVQVWSAVAPGNTGSLRAFAKTGFRLVAETTIWNGRVTAHVLAATTPDEAAALACLNAGA